LKKILAPGREFVDYEFISARGERAGASDLLNGFIRPPAKVKLLLFRYSERKLSMASQTLHVVATLVAQSEKIEIVRKALLDLIEPTREEPGCLGYELYQSQQDPKKFVFVEEYTDEAALDAHLGTPYVQAALAAADSILESAPEIRRFKVTE
jgi:quinol monooxygenase YgiN